MRRISIGSWAYTIGPYADRPVDFDTVCTKLKELVQGNTVDFTHATRVPNLVSDVRGQRDIGVRASSVNWVVSKCSDLLHDLRRDKHVSDTLSGQTSRSAVSVRRIDSLDASHQSVDVMRNDNALSRSTNNVTQAVCACFGKGFS